MKKRIISLLLCLALGLGLLPQVTLFAGAEPLSGKCGSQLRWTLDGKQLIITGSGKMTDFDEEAPPWTQYAHNIEALVLPEGLTHIGNAAFAYLDGITSLTLPESLTSIGDDAFYGCTGLDRELVIPNKVSRIGREAFFGCNGIPEVTLGSALWIVDPQAFAGCSSLQAFSVAEDNQFLFADADGVLLSKDRSVLRCFPGGLPVETYTIPDGVKEVGQFAFFGCPYLCELTVPKTVQNIGTFLACPQLSEIHIQEDHPYLSTDRCGVIFNKDKTTLFCAATANCGHYEVPSSVYLIADYAFAFCDPVSVTIPGSVRTIGNYAFCYCLSLRSVTIEQGVRSIGAYAFLNCSSLTDLRLPTSLNVISEYAFFDCNMLTAVAIPPAVRTVCEAAFGIYESYDKDAGAWYLYRVNGFTIYGEPYSGAMDYAYAYGLRFVTGYFATPFVDVRPGEYYVDPVLWAVENRITSGTSPLTFSPNEGCTRAQVVTFLWRAAGSPEPESGNNPFSDVKADAYYYDAVLWAVENEITAGTSKTAFSPNKSCTRAQVVTFLWRFAGKPEIGEKTNPFTDVKQSDYYYDAVLWALENRITDGTSKTTFSPDKSCTRAQVVTFLYRDR